MTVHHLPPAGDIRAERGKRQRHASASAIRRYIEGRVLDGTCSQVSTSLLSELAAQRPTSYLDTA